MPEQNARPLPLQTLDSDQLDQLVRLIRRNQCALILGPHSVSTEEKGRRIPLRSLLARELAEELAKTTGPALPDPYDLPMVSTAYMSRPDESRSKLEMKVEDFYLRQTEPGLLLRQIAHLPFPIILTASPDTLLQQAFKKEGAQRYAEGYYHLGETQRDNYDETAKVPYIYQLFGKVSDDTCEGLVLTQQDQMRYIDSVQGVGKETRLPTALRNALQRCKGFLFVGFDFEYWYLRVLLHILEISKSADTVFGLHESAGAPLPDTTHVFFKQQYKFTFLDTTPEVLLTRLRERFSEGKEPESVGSKPTLRLLYLYAPEDETLKTALDRHLTALKDKYGFTAAGIHDILPGEDIETARRRAVDAANLIVPLLSADFAANDWLAETLLPRALARHGGERVRVAGVYAKPLDGAAGLLQGKAPLLPDADMSIADFASPDRAFQRIAQELEKMIQGMI